MEPASTFLSCGKPTGHICVKCNQKTCAILPCGREVDGEGGVQCFLCTKSASAVSHRQGAKRKQEDQAERMMERSNKKFKPAEVGDNVVVHVSELDRGRADHRNVMAVVMSVDERGCRLETKQGVLQPLYLRSMFDLCKTNGFISVSDVPVEKIISLREAATNESVGSGQGFVRCNCKKEACGVSNRCLCRAQGRLCNIVKCHKSTGCCNK